MAGQMPASAQLLTCQSGSGVLTVNINGSTSSASPLDISASGPGNQAGSQYAFSGSGVTTTSCSGSEIPSGTAVAPSAGTIVLSQPANSTEQSDLLAFNGTAPVPNVTLGSGLTTVTAPGGFPGVAVGDTVTDVTNPSALPRGTVVLAVPTDTVTLSTQAPLAASNAPVQFEFALSGTVTGTSDALSAATPIVQPGMVVESDTAGCFAGSDIVTNTSWPTTSTSTTVTLSSATGSCSSPTADSVTFGTTASVDSTAGSSELTGTADGSGAFPYVVPGMTATGDNLPGGTTVSQSPNSLVLSTAATCSAESDGLTFSNSVSGVLTTYDSTVVSVVSGGFPGVVPGMNVSSTGSGVSAGTFVKWVNGNEVGLSQPVLANSTATFSFSTPNPIDAQVTAGVKSVLVRNGGFPDVAAGMSVSDSGGCLSGASVSSVGSQSASSVALTNAPTASNTYDLTFGASVLNVSVTDGSTAATAGNGASFPGVVPGMAVSGTFVNPGTTVAAINGNSLTLSAAATGDTTGALDFSTAVPNVATTDGFPLVSASSGSLSSLQPGMSVSGAFNISVDPKLVLTGQSGQPQYVTIDNENGYLASAAAGCDPQVRIQLPPGTSDTLAVIDDANTPAPGDDNVGLTSSTSGPTEEVNVAEGACSTPDVAVPSGFALPAVNVEGGNGNDTLDLSGETTPSAVTIAGPTTTLPGQVTGLPGLTQTVTFSGFSSILGPQATTDFQPGTSTTSSIDFVGAPGQTNILDLSQQPGSGLLVAMDGDSPTNPGFFFGGPLSDQFSNVNHVLGGQAGTTTTFEAGPTPGVSFTAGASTASLQLPTSASQDILDAGGTVTFFAGTDHFDGISQFFGNFGSGGTDFVGQSSGGLEFLGQGSGGNELDLSGAPVNLAITLNGDSTGSLGTATGLNPGLGASTADTFAGITTVVGSSLSSTSHPTVFNLSCLGGLTLNGHQGAALEVSSGSCASDTPTVDASTGTLSGLPGGNDSFSGMSSFVAPTSGDTTFVAPGNTGGLTFTGEGSGNSLDGSAMPPGTSLNAASGTAQLTSKLSDVFSGISCFVGSSGGSTTFVAPPAGFSALSPCVEYPSQPSVLGQGSGNTLDLTPLGGSLVTIDTGAQDVTGAPTPMSFAGIQRFTGPAGGNTTFLSGSNGGYTFTGQGPGNVLSFGEVPPTGGVTVSLVPNVSGEESAQPGSGTDLFSDIGDIHGSPGNDTFLDGPGSYSITGEGGNDTFSAASAPSGLTLNQSAGTATATGGYAGTKTLNGVTTFVGSTAGGNSFATDGTGGYSFDAPGSTGNSLSFASATATGLSVEVTSATGNGTASGLSGPPTTDAFEGIQSFTGSGGGGTSFDLGNGAFAITGETGAPNSLSFYSATGGVTVDLVHGTAKAGPSASVVNDTFSGIQDFTGSAAGSNDFLAAPAGGYTLDGAGTGNTLDLAAASSGTTVSENGGSGSVTGLSAPSSDFFTNIEDFVGPSSGGAFLPGCIGGAEFQSTAASVILELPSGCGQLTIDTTQSPGVISGLQGDTTDTFSGVKQFTASPSGGTTFVASGSTGGYSFDGAGTSNTFDASAFAAGATIDDSTAQATSGKVVDTFSNVACFVGSSSGATTFVASSSVAPDPTGCAGAAYNFSGQGSGNILDLSQIPVAVDIVLSSPTSGVVETPSSTVYDNFSDIQTATGAHQPSTTTVVSTTPNPVVGQPISIGVQVSGAFTGPVIPGPTGQVTISDGTNSCKATLSGSAGVSVGSCSIIEQSPGSYSFNASYPGDGSFEASATSAATSVGVTTASSATTITGTTSSPVVGEPVTIDVSVAGQYESAKAPAPTGVVTVSDGTNSCDVNLAGSGGLSSGSCSVVETSIGTYTFTASYPGDGNFDASHASPSAETVGESSTVTKITSVTTEPVVGQPIVVDVSVSGQYHNAQAPAPSGAVTVNAGTRSCLANLSGSVGLATGSCSIIETTPGVYHFSASYPSDGNFLASKTWGVQFKVNKAPTQTQLSISGAPAVFGHEQSLRITVSVIPSYTGTPTGDILVRAGTVTVCKLSKVTGSASCNLSRSEFEAGHWKVTASYGGSPDFLASKSAAVGFNIKKAATSTPLSLSAASVGYGDEQVEHMTVTVKPQFAGMPTGLVELRSGKTVLCKVNLVKGGGSCTLSSSELNKGSYSIVAVYTGSTDFLSSSSPAAKLKVT